jgi:dolichyl-phosphate-mannose--protein O-mannosyl transferase
MKALSDLRSKLYYWIIDPILEKHYTAYRAEKRKLKANYPSSQFKRFMVELHKIQATHNARLEKKLSRWEWLKPKNVIRPKP